MLLPAFYHLQIMAQPQTLPSIFCPQLLQLQTQSSPKGCKCSIVQVLREPGSRLHVQLTAHQGVGLHASDAEMQRPSGQADECQPSRPVELLSGFVSYEQMGDAMGSSTRPVSLFRRQEEAVLSLRGPGVQSTVSSGRSHLQFC